MKNGSTVAAFEREFAAYVGAKYAIALCNGTATLHTALVALGVKPGDRVAVPPLTMSATTLAVLQAGARPVFLDVDPATWLMKGHIGLDDDWNMPVSLYGLHSEPDGPFFYRTVDDAAQTLRPHGKARFTSYSFQASKILALGEGGMLVTNDEALATCAREFSSLGYRMRADQPRIDPAVIKSPTYERHHSLGWNYRMNDVTAGMGLLSLGSGDPWPHISELKQRRVDAAAQYRRAIEGCPWLTPQHVPEGWTHDYWAFAVACDTSARALLLQDKVERLGGERPYGAWRLTYEEPAFKHLAPRPVVDSCEAHPMYACPNAHFLQPRLLQFQTNDLASAEKNAAALRLAIDHLS